MEATVVTLNDLKSHSPLAGLFKCNPSNICAEFYTISTHSVLARFLCISRASCYQRAVRLHNESSRYYHDVLPSVRLSVCLRRACIVIYTVHFSADVSSCWIVQCPGHSDIKACPPIPSRLFSSSTGKRCGVWMCKLGEGLIELMINKQYVGEFNGRRLCTGLDLSQIIVLGCGLLNPHRALSPRQLSVLS